VNIEFVRNRIAFLRTNKNMSARELSLRLGQSTTYINHIENGNSKPSLEMLFEIADELGVTMSQFFDETDNYPELNKKIIKLTSNLDKKSLESVIMLLENLKK